jgi:hypothetical protein
VQERNGTGGYRGGWIREEVVEGWGGGAEKRFEE